MVLASIALLMLADPAVSPTTSDDSVIEPVSAAPASAPPAAGAPPLPSPTDDAPTPAPPSTEPETIEGADPASARLPPPVRPNGSFGLELGYAHGGDRFLTVVSPTTGPTGSSNAGDGAFFSLAGSWTPYWSTSGVGLGVYARAGAKLSAARDAATTASYFRCPLAVGAQLLLPVVGRWFALGRLGVMTEVLQQLEITSGGGGRSSANFSSTLGEFLDAGVLWTPANFTGFAAIARYERLDVSYAGDVMTASNLGLLAAGYLRF
ncbi:MAG TPA: hypothetical protein VN903_02875 [Polyangia bacterium]|jgi:hypothetical protein|nr:hypothetical protein [Polyangia bacterium]